MRTICLSAFVLLLGSCNIGKQYANYRHGGKSDETNFPSVKSEIESPDEKTSTIPEFCLEEIKNQDDLLLSERKTERIHVFPPSEKIIPSSDSLRNKNSGFLMDEALSTAYSSAALNGMAALFGFLTLSSPNAIWFAAPLYIAGGIFSLVGIIAFFVSLARFSSGKIDRRNKKYYGLWVLVFCLSLLFALIPLLILF